MSETPEEEPVAHLGIGFTIQEMPDGKHHTVMHVQAPTINIAVVLGNHQTVEKLADHMYNSLNETARQCHRADSGLVIASPDQIPKVNGS